MPPYVSRQSDDLARAQPAPSQPRPKASTRPHSVRFDPVFERRVHAAAAHEGVSVSDFIREAVQERAERILGATSLWERIRPIVEDVPASGRTTDVASRTHAAFAELLVSRHAEDSRE